MPARLGFGRFPVSRNAMIPASIRDLLRDAEGLVAVRGLDVPALRGERSRAALRAHRALRRSGAPLRRCAACSAHLRRGREAPDQEIAHSRLLLLAVP